MRVLVTGATGYIGGALARRLVADGCEVRALVRPTSQRQELEGLGVECCEGDILELESLKPAVRDCDWVVHAAAELDLDATLARMRETNVVGSENMALAAYEGGVGRFLLLSSVASFGGSPRDGSPTVEPGVVQRPLPTRYCITKHEGERAVAAWAGRGLAVNIVYPSLVYGPPGKKRGTNAILRNIVTGRMPVMVGGDRKVSWVFLGDLVDGLRLVMKRAAPGRHYLMTGEVRTLREVTATACALAGVEPPRREIPIAVARALAPIAALAGRLLGKRTPLTPQVVRSIERHWCFDDSRARTELDWSPRGLDQGLPPTVEFLLALA